PLVRPPRPSPAGAGGAHARRPRAHGDLRDRGEGVHRPGDAAARWDPVRPRRRRLRMLDRGDLPGRRLASLPDLVARAAHAAARRADACGVRRPFCARGGFGRAARSARRADRLPGVLVSELVRKAEEVAERAYAPYSRYHVGAVVRTVDGREFVGVNVENAAYP